LHAELTLISTIAVGFGAALALGFLAVRLRLPAIVGYLLAGVLLGPATPGFVADLELANQLAEIGVMLLMFGVGLHFSVEDLLAVRRIAVPGAVVQIVVATAMGMAVAHWWGWGWGAGLVFGLSLSVASTVVLLRALEVRGVLDSLNGRIAVGWLIVEDLVTVLVLVLLPALAGWLGPSGGAGGSGLWVTLVSTLGQVGVFVILMIFGGRRLFPWVLWHVARTGSRELFTLCVIAAAIGVAFLSSELFGVSFALGAFFAGMMLRESALSHRAAEESLPLRDAFSVLFFVSVGMLFDPSILIDEPLHVLVAVAIVMLGKSVAAFLIVIAFRYTMNTALTVSASLAQIGEFSFILAGMGVALGLMPQEGSDLVLAASLVSIAANHLVFAAIEPTQSWIRKHPKFANQLDRPLDPLAALPMEVGEAELTGHVVLVGYGRVGRRIGEALSANRIRFVVAEQNREIVEALRERGVHAVKGNASDPVVLAQTHVMRARLLVVATPDLFATRKMIETARILNPRIATVVRTHSEEEAELLRREHADDVFMGEHELAQGMIRSVLGRVEEPAAARTV
jgi:CPA2 family monovalent cation:H+ antiporter-2